MEPSILDVETWLEWQAWKLGTLAWWAELKAILGIRDHQKLARKFRVSFYIPEVRMRTIQEPEYTVPPAPRSLYRNAFLPDELSYQDVRQQPAPLMIAYASSLQYWVEQQQSTEKPESQSFSGKCHQTMRSSQRVCHLQPSRHCARFRGD